MYKLFAKRDKISGRITHAQYSNPRGFVGVNLFFTTGNKKLNAFASISQYQVITMVSEVKINKGNNNSGDMLGIYYVFARKDVLLSMFFMSYELYHSFIRTIRV